VSDSDLADNANECMVSNNDILQKVFVIQQHCCLLPIAASVG
jgi:hypothetical protein